MQNEIQNLETNIFNAIERAYKAIELNDRDNAKAYIATIECLNDEYKDITHIDFVRQSVILDLYERLWRKANA